MDTHSGSRDSVPMTMERDPGLSSVCCDSREFDEWEADTRQQMLGTLTEEGRRCYCCYLDLWSFSSVKLRAHNDAHLLHLRRELSVVFVSTKLSHPVLRVASDTCVDTQYPSPHSVCFT